MAKVKYFGTEKDGEIFSIDEEKLTLEYIRQMRNYLDVREGILKNENSKNKKLKTLK